MLFLQNISPLLPHDSLAETAACWEMRCIIHANRILDMNGQGDAQESRKLG